MPVTEGVILGAGNPLLDICANCPPEYLEKYGMKANDSILAEDKHVPLCEEMKKLYEVEYYAGGATQNSIRVAQWLLKKPLATSYIGSVGKDDNAKILQKKAEECGVKVLYHEDEEHPTGTCAALLTDGGKNRSLCAYLAAANHYKIDHLNRPEVWKVVENSKLVYSAGFFLTVSVESMIQMAKLVAQKEHTYLLNLSAPFLCRFFKEQMMSVMPYVDILFGNETEAKEFSDVHQLGLTDVAEIAATLQKLPMSEEKKNKSRIVVITQGDQPTVVATSTGVEKFPIIRLTDDQIKDTNGAGDAFVGGFLASLAQGYPIKECVRCGHYAASVIIQRSGCSYPDEADFDWQ